MRLLGTNDYKDYNGNNIITRTSARCIVIENNKIFLSHSKKFNFYKLPGGGVNKDEQKRDAAAREALEEAGITIDKENMKLYGVFVDKWKSVKNNENAIWLNKSYHYICQRIGEIKEIEPTESEIYDDVEGVLVDIDTAINANEERMRSKDYSSKQRFLERETIVFKLIKKELMK